jgi:hypothetical protein
MPYTYAPGEFDYNGVPVGTLLNMPVYADSNLTAVKHFSDGTTQNINYSKGDFIGNLYSWYTDGNTGKSVLLFYLTDSDYNNFIYTTISVNVKTKTPAAKEIAQNLADANKTWYEKLIDKYAPYVVGGVVIWLAFPSIATGAKRLLSRNKSVSGFKDGVAPYLLVGGVAYILTYKSNAVENLSVQTALPEQKTTALLTQNNTNE